MEKYFKPLAKENIAKATQGLFVQDKIQRRKRIEQHLDAKYITIDCEDDCVIIEEIPSHQSASPSPASTTSPYFQVQRNNPIPLSPPTSRFCPTITPQKRSFDQSCDNNDKIMSSKWPSPKRFKSPPQEAKPVEPSPPTQKKIISYIPSTSPAGSITRALSGINGFQELNKRKRFKDKLYKGKTLASLHQTPWASAPTKILPKDNGMKAKLTAEQKKVITMALEGVSLFFTGSAGTGKSFVLRVMVEELQLKHGYSSVFVTASTGMAGCNIQGVTLHSFAGLGLAKGSKEELAIQVKKKQHVIQRWNRAKVLIIDEISMISADFFTKVEYVARKLRECERPFGGLQVILCGDFFQLPPVKSDDFCFESEAWKRVVEANIELKQVIRQKNPEFVKVLNEIRIGKVSNESLALLRGRVGAVIETRDGIVPTKLYPHRCDVSQENKDSLDKEMGEVVSYTATDTGDSYHVQQLDSHCQAPKVLELKKGCQVMLLKNLDFKNSLVNGSRGIVVSFTTDPEQVGVHDPHADVQYPVVRFSDGSDHIIVHDTWRIELAGQVRASRFQIPLTLAYALSIHKSQGMSIEKVDLSLSKVFTYGQAYVALSRVTSLEGLRLANFSPEIIRAHPKVISFYNSFKEHDFHVSQLEEPPSFWSDEDEETKQTHEKTQEHKDIKKPLPLPLPSFSSSNSFRTMGNFGGKSSTMSIAPKTPISCGHLSPKQLPLHSKSSHIDLT